MGGSDPARGRRIARCATAGVTVALMVAGCGSDSGTSSGGGGKDASGGEPATGGLDREQLAQKAEPICKRHFEKISADAGKALAGGKLPDPRKFGELAQKTIIPEYSAQIQELRALKPADDVKAQYSSFLQASQDTLAKVKQNPGLISDTQNFKDVNSQAQKLGLPMQCRFGPG